MFTKIWNKIKNTFKKEEEMGHLLNGGWVPTQQQILNAKRIDGFGPEDDIFVQLGLVELPKNQETKNKIDWNSKINWIDSSVLPDLPLAAKFEIAECRWSLRYKKDGGFVLYTNSNSTKYFLLNENGKPVTLEMNGNLDEPYNVIFFNDLQNPNVIDVDENFKCCGRGCDNHSKFSERFEWNKKKLDAGIPVLKMIEAYNA